MLRLENLRTRIALTPVIAEGGVAVHVTVSAGVAIRGAGRGFDDLYADADRALYAAKNSDHAVIDRGDETSSVA